MLPVQLQGESWEMSVVKRAFLSETECALVADRGDVAFTGVLELLPYILQSLAERLAQYSIREMDAVDGDNFGDDSKVLVGAGTKIFHIHVKAQVFIESEIVFSYK